MPIPPLEIALLGGFSAQLNQAPIDGFRSDKIRALLAYLAVEADRPHRREVLATLLWSEMPESVARRNLRQSLHRLKQTIGLDAEWLLMTRQTVQLVSDWVTTDVALFQQNLLPTKHDQTVSDEQLQQLEAAVTHYKGEFLEGVQIGDAFGFMEWQVIQREAYHQQALAAQQMLADGYLQRGNYEAVHHYVRLQLALEPWREVAHRQAMQAFIEQGRRAAALAQYERCGDVLWDELGVAVSAETTALITQIQATASEPTVGITPEDKLIAKVYEFWIDGLLQDILGDALPIGLQWEVSAETATSNENTNDIQAQFFASQQSLLILGEPGAGKTATLLTLVRDLMQQKIAWLPVVLNLSTWSASTDSFEEWLVEALQLRYRVPRKLSQQWIVEQKLGLFLDGLDEIAEADQTNCIQAINLFHAQYADAPVVVASRSAEYNQQSIKLALNTEMTLQPLAVRQIIQRLSRHDPELLALTQTNQALGELVRTPLMLTILDSLEQESLATSLLSHAAANSEQTIRQQLFDLYLDNQLQSDDSGKGHIQYLAQTTLKHNHSVFQLEQIQPSWLPQKHQRLLYLLLTRVPLGFLVGIAIGLFTEMGTLANPNFRLQVSEWLGARLPAWLPEPDFWAMVLWNWSMIIPLVLLDYYFYERKLSRAQPSPQALRESVIVTSVLIAYPILFTSIFDGLALGMVAGLLAGGGYILLFGLRRDQRGYHNDIETIEATGWSWNGALRGMAIGLPIGMLGSWLLAGNLTQLTYLSLLFMLFMGLRGQQIPQHTHPNQGIHLTATNALRIGGLSAIIAGLLNSGTGLIYPLFSTISFGLLTMAAFGGFQVIKHYALRFCLGFFQLTPFNLADFLSRNADNMILRRLGDGYTFIHQLLQEHLAQETQPVRDFSAE